ncbi:MAG: hypothetical protein P4L83_21985 [Nevskia sp.]|nr:hypothetical protein [Nevskia sp.]
MQLHAVIIEFSYGSTDLDPLYEFEDRLEDAISEAGVGEYDGHELAIDGSGGRLYLYGPDADRLYAAIEYILNETPFMLGAEVCKRYGPAADDTPQETLTVDG